MKPNSYPKVSVIVAARNEECNIQDCILALTNQDYPEDLYNIWIGDDNSIDDTASIVQNMRNIFSQIHLLRVKEKISNLIGKANVLAQLAHKADGEILLITDADVRVSSTWIKFMVSQFTPDISLISGTVALNGESTFALLQNADWIYYLAECNKKSEKGQPVTAIGCNMAIRATVYRAIGGYENIPFSVTEDYELFRAVLNAGYGAKNLLHKELLAFTSPVESFTELLNQRRRWLTGSFRENWRFVVGFNLKCLFLPVLIIAGFFIGFAIPAIIFLSKWLMDILFLREAYNKLDLEFNRGVFFYTPYMMICNCIYLSFQFLPTPIEWKGRTYNK